MANLLCGNNSSLKLEYPTEILYDIDQNIWKLASKYTIMNIKKVEKNIITKYPTYIGQKAPKNIQILKN